MLITGKGEDHMDRPYLTPEEASGQLGMAPVEIRRLMRLGLIDLGLAVPPAGGKTKWRFFIYQDKINKITGKEAETA